MCSLLKQPIMLTGLPVCTYARQLNKIGHTLDLTESRRALQPKGKFFIFIQGNQCVLLGCRALLGSIKLPSQHKLV